MLVEDDRSARKALSLILRKKNFVLLEAGTIAEAMIGLTHRPSWVLLDLMLPDGNGVEVLHRIREVRMETKVCVITGCNCQVRDSALSAGADHAMSKPLDLDALIALLSR